MEHKNPDNPEQKEILVVTAKAKPKKWLNKKTTNSVDGKQETNEKL